jgi:hypothetical protein
MRACLAKARLYAKLFKKPVEPWSIIPYNYKPVNELEGLLNTFTAPKIIVCFQKELASLT